MQAPVQIFTSVRFRSNWPSPKYGDGINRLLDTGDMQCRGFGDLCAFECDVCPFRGSSRDVPCNIRAVSVLVRVVVFLTPRRHLMSTCVQPVIWYITS